MDTCIVCHKLDLMTRIEMLFDAKWICCSSLANGFGAKFSFSCALVLALDRVAAAEMFCRYQRIWCWHIRGQLRKLSR